MYAASVNENYTQDPNVQSWPAAPLPSEPAALTAEDDARVVACGWTNGPKHSTLPDFGVRRWIVEPKWTLVFGITALLLASTILKNVPQGSIGSLSHPTNYQGLGCGWDTPVADHPYLYFPIDPAGTRGKFTIKADRPLCVAHCPTPSDVELRGTVDIPQTSVVSEKRGAAVVSVEHFIKSPMYATAENGGYCVPINDDLQDQVHEALSDRGEFGGLKQWSRGIYHSIPLFAGIFVASAIGSYISARVLMFGPGASILVALCASILALLSLTIKMLLLNSSPVVPFSGASAPSLYALMSLGATLLITASTFYHWKYYSESSVVSKAIGETLLSLSHNLYGLTMAAQLLAAILLFSCMSYILAVSSASTLPMPMAVAQGGRISYLASTQSAVPPAGKIFEVFLVLLATGWMLEVILATVKFASTYTGAVYFFTLPDYAQQRRLSVNVPIFATFVACKAYLGTLAQLAIARAVTRPLRVVFGPSLSQRYQKLQSSHITVAPTTDFKRRVCDQIHNGIFCELAMNTRTGKDAMKTAWRRLQDPEHEVAAGLFGLSSMAVWAHVMCAGVLGFCAAMFVLVPGALSGTEVGHPFLISCCIGVAAAFMLGLQLSHFDAFGDALLYSQMVEADGKAGAYGRNFGSNLADQTLCPNPIIELMEDAGQRGLCTQDDDDRSMTDSM